MGTPGSGNGLGKRAGRNPGTAPQADFTLDLAVRRLSGGRMSSTRRRGGGIPRTAGRI